MKKHILIIDDSITTREFLSSVLEKAGYKTSFAKDGKKGYQLIKNEEYDLIITDLLMPEMDGHELLEKLNKITIKIPIIVISADIQEEVKRECFNLGAKEFLNKPILDPETILIPVKKLLK